MKNVKSMITVLLSVCLLCIVGCCRAGKCPLKPQADDEKQSKKQSAKQECGCDSCKSES